VAKKRGRAVHIQTDAVRSMVGNPTYTRSESKFVYRSVTAVAEEALKAGYDAILDGTYLREEFREEAITKLAGLYKTKLIIHVSCDVFLAYRRNLSRPEKVPKESFLRLYSHFQSPREALRIDTDKTTPEIASEDILMQVGHLRSLERDG
jgi:predicted kinase